MFLTAPALASAPHRHHRPRHAAPARYYHIRPGRALVVVPPAAAKPPPPPRTRIPTAADLYARTLNADDRYSYRGKRITTAWKTGRAVAVVASHRAPSLLRLDWVYPYNQRGRSTVTTPTQEWQFLPAKGLLLHRAVAPSADAVADAEARYDLLKTNYILQVLPEKQTWANRKVFVLTVTRKSNRTPALKLWVDAATGLPLKREYFREDGRLSITVAFSDINFHPALSPALFNLAPLAKRPGVRVSELPTEHETPIPLTAARAQLGGHAVVPPALDGYRLVWAALGRDGRRPRLHLTYSDGLVPVTLFEIPRVQTRRPTPVPRPSHPFREGRVAGRVVQRPGLTFLIWDSGPLNLWLVGEIGERPLARLAADIP